MKTIGMGVGLYPMSGYVRRNLLPNATTTGAVIGTIGAGGALPNSWSVNSAGGLATAVEDIQLDVYGYPSIAMRVSGTPSAAAYNMRFNSSQSVPALINQQWVASFYAELVGGSTANISSAQVWITEETAATAFVGGTATIFALGARVRGGSTRTLTGASTAGVENLLRLSLTIGLAIDVTIRLSAPQLERGSIPTAVQIVG